MVKWKHHLINLFLDRSSVSLSDLPINPPPPDANEDALTSVNDQNAPLSTMPSPFLSYEIYLDCHKHGIEQAVVARQKEVLETTALLKQAKLEMDKIGSDISSSEDEVLTGEHIEQNYSPICRDGVLKYDVKNEKDDDQMSLSSLSSTEQRIEESNIPEPPSNMMSQPPFSGGSFNPYQQYSGIFYIKFVFMKILTRV